jgi:hypothetical protein
MGTAGSRRMDFALILAKRHRPGREASRLPAESAHVLGQDDEERKPAGKRERHAG